MATGVKCTHPHWVIDKLTKTRMCTVCCYTISCAYCDGTGYYWNEPCWYCSKDGKILKQSKVKPVEIKIGVQDEPTGRKFRKAEEI